MPHHDDLIMAIAMSLYVAQNSFTQLKKNVNQAKAMLDSWVVNEHAHPNDGGKPVFEPSRIKMKGELPPPNITLHPQSNDMKDYLWLFGGLK